MITSFRYSSDTGLVISQAPEKEDSRDCVIWTDIEQPGDAEVRMLEDVYGFHPLAVEDCIKAKQRSKLDDYRDYFFLVLHYLCEGSNGAAICVNELGIFAGHNYIVTFHWEKSGPVSSVRERIEKNPELMSRGIDYILYLLLDTVVDEYFPILDSIDDRFSLVEAKLLNDPRDTDVNELSGLRRNLVEMRKILSPYREMVNALIRYEGLFIREENRVFYMDVYDHLMRIFDFLDTYRDLISGSLDVYLTVVSNKMNEVMKTLTVIATIMLPLTLISSIYGMNFRDMPELSWRYGYIYALGLMLATAGGLIYYFRKKKWF